MNEFIFRWATVDDLDSLVQLRLEFLTEVSGALESDSNLCRAISEFFIGAIPAGEFVAAVAIADSQIIATSGLVYHRNPPSNTYNGREAYIMNMYTRPQWRGQGIATKLLHMLIEYAREHSCDRVSLHFHPQGQSIYAKAGFSLIGTEMRLSLGK